MKYRGFVITPEYNCGAHFKILKGSGAVVDRKPTKADIEYYVIYDPMENMGRWGAGDDVYDCKKQIDSLLRKMGMKSNLPKEWEKLDEI